MLIISYNLVYILLSRNYLPTNQRFVRRCYIHFTCSDILSLPSPSLYLSSLPFSHFISHLCRTKPFQCQGQKNRWPYWMFFFFHFSYFFLWLGLSRRSTHLYMPSPQKGKRSLQAHLLVCIYWNKWTTNCVLMVCRNGSQSKGNFPTRIYMSVYVHIIVLKILVAHTKWN